MSSRPPPPPPLYSREALPSLTAPPLMDTAAQATAGPLPLPPPSFLTAHLRRDARPPPLAPIAPLSIYPSVTSPRYRSPSYAPFGPEGHGSFGRGQPPAGQPYTPPRSDPSYSPGYTQSMHAHPEYITHPPLPGLEQRTWAFEARRDIVPYPSPAYPDVLAHGEGSRQPGTPRRSMPGPSFPGDVSLVEPEPTPAVSRVLQYEIRVRQQPRAARACGFGERDRRVIDPPPIVQLTIIDPNSGAVEGAAELRYPFNVVHCTLWNEDGTMDETAIAGRERRVNRRLMGTLVASPFVALDELDHEGCFFCFPDLSCRTHGKYRLKFVLMRIDMESLRPGGFMPVITSTMSDVFEVFTAKEFPGMQPSTLLTRALKRQGCAIPVKKGNERAVASARAQNPAPEGEEEGGEP